MQRKQETLKSVETALAHLQLAKCALIPGLIETDGDSRFVHDNLQEALKAIADASIEFRLSNV